MDRSQAIGARLFPCLLVVLALIGATSAFAQGQGNGTFTGTVTDNDGVLPGATVTVTDPSTGLIRSIQTNEQGIF